MSTSTNATTASKAKASTKKRAVKNRSKSSKPSTSNTTKKPATAKTTKKPSAKKPSTAKKPAAKKPAAKKPTKAPVVKKDNDGLRAGQVRILQFLAKDTDVMANRAEVVKGSGCSPTHFVYLMGSHNVDKRTAADKSYLSLVTQKLVKISIVDEDGKDVVRYKITALGVKKAEKLAS